MYNNNKITNNIYVLYIIVSLYVFIIFPLSINVGAVFVYNHKKCFFTIRFFNVIKIFCGYIELKKDGVLIHYKNDKAKLLLFSGAKNINKNAKPLLDYHLLNFNMFVDYNGNSELINHIVSFLFIYVRNYFIWFLRHKKPYLNFNSEININSKNTLNVIIEFKILFNLLMIIISIIKIVWGKWLNANKRK